MEELEFNIDMVTIKYMPRDVIGEQPKKVGDRFEALFMNSTYTFEVVEFHGDFWMAKFTD